MNGVNHMRIKVNELRQLLNKAITEGISALEKQVRQALLSYVKDNDKEPLEAILPSVLELRKNKKFNHLLEVGDHEYAYRIDEFSSEKELQDLIKSSTVGKTGYVIKKGGVFTPEEGTISSWTINPRSLVYSGFLSTVPKNKSLVLFRAKIKDNQFIGNPDSMSGTIKAGEGYSLEREIIGIGDIRYDKAIYRFKDKDQSLEGLMMDLINKVLGLEDIKFTDDYYYPEKL